MNTWLRERFDSPQRALVTVSEWSVVAGAIGIAIFLGYAFSH